MATELDALPQDFYEAIHEIACNVGTEEYAPVVRDYCERLAEENARLRPMLTARSQEMLRLVSESGELKTRAEKAEARVQELERENGELRKSALQIERECREAWRQAAYQGSRAERAESELAALKARIAGSMRAYHSSFEYTLDATTLYARAVGVPGEETYALVKVEE